MGDEGGKRWEMVHGLAPKGLNIETNGSRRLFKKSLKEWFDSKKFDPEELGQNKEELLYIIDKCMAALRSVSVERSDEFAAQLFASKPVFSNWKKVEATVLNAITVSNEQKEA